MKVYHKSYHFCISDPDRAFKGMIRRAEIQLLPRGEKFYIDFLEGVHDFAGVAIDPAVEATGLTFTLKETHHDWYGMRFDVIKVYGCLLARESLLLFYDMHAQQHLVNRPRLLGRLRTRILESGRLRVRPMDGDRVPAGKLLPRRRGPDQEPEARVPGRESLLHQHLPRVL